MMRSELASSPPHVPLPGEHHGDVAVLQAHRIRRWARDGKRKKRRALIVEIRPEGTRRHNNPLSVLPPPKGNAAEGPPRRKAEELSH
jgi:hypothetical protein